MGCLSTKEASDPPASSQEHHGGGGGASPVAQPQAEEQEQEQMWYYIDLEKVLQGPFGTSQMKLWLNQGYLPDDLEVRAASEASFTQLRYRKHEIDPSFEREFPTGPSQQSPQSQPQAQQQQPQQQPQVGPPQPQAPGPSQPTNAPPVQDHPPSVGPPTVPDASIYHPGQQENGAPADGKQRAVVLYPYQAQRDDELSIKRADVVTIVYEGRNWCEVSRKGQSGKVPGNYIEKIMPTEKVIAMYDYTPDGLPSCLTFKKDEIIEVVEKQADGWWKGIHQESLGAFPSSFVQQI